MSEPRTWETGTTELAPGVFAYVQATGGHCIANAGIIAGRDGATVVDALFTPAMTRALLDETRRVAPGEIARLLNTHHHLDHTLGNGGFPASTQIISHARARAEMERVGMPIAAFTASVPHFAEEVRGIEPRLPDRTFEGGALELDAGGTRVRLLHFGTAHTRGDILVHLPEQRLLFAGDLAFFYVTPLAFEGHIGKWIAVCKRIIAEFADCAIVPGHGPVGGVGELAKMTDYLERVHAHATEAFRAGVSAEEAAHAFELGEYGAWNEEERVVANVRRVYQELRGEIDF
jgi:cyclase